MYHYRQMPLNTHATVQSVFVLLVTSVMENVPFVLLVKQTNVLSILSNSGHLSYRYLWMYNPARM